MDGIIGSSPKDEKWTMNTFVAEIPTTKNGNGNGHHAQTITVDKVERKTVWHKTKEMAIKAQTPTISIKDVFGWLMPLVIAIIFSAIGVYIASTRHEMEINAIKTENADLKKEQRLLQQNLIDYMRESEQRITRLEAKQDNKKNE